MPWTSTAVLVEGLIMGAAAALAMIIAMVGLQVVEAWRFSTTRGPLGALASVGRAWLHARRDSDRVAGAVAALGAVGIPCGAAALVVAGGLHAMSVAVAVLLAATGVPVVAALAGGPGGEARLALDDALRRSARHALVVGSTLVAPPVVQGLVALAAVAAVMRQRHEAPPGLQPRADVALGAGTRMALDAGDRGTAILLAVTVGAALASTWGLSDPGHRAAVVVVATLLSVAFGVAVAEVGGPQRTAVRGLGGPLVLLVVAVGLRLLLPTVGLAAAAVAADAVAP